MHANQESRFFLQTINNSKKKSTAQDTNAITFETAYRLSKHELSKTAHFLYVTFFKSPEFDTKTSWM